MPEIRFGSDADPGGTLPMFDTEPLARTTDPQTSHDAATSAPHGKALTKAQNAVLRILRDKGPMTDTDLQGWYYARMDNDAYPRQSVSGIRTRRKELTKAGLVTDSGERGKLPTGRRAIIWASTED